MSGNTSSAGIGSVAAQLFPGRIAISIEEFADAVGIGRTNAYLAAKRGDFPTRRVGRRYVVPLASLEEWFALPQPLPQGGTDE